MKHEETGKQVDTEYMNLVQGGAGWRTAIAWFGRGSPLR
jgi:hypothetical protein